MHTFSFQLAALLLACNYFAFRVELCEEEYERNHRPISAESAVGTPTINWETFDKDNASKAFVFTVESTIEFLHYLPAFGQKNLPPLLQFNLIRDKSPPLFA